MANVSVDDLRAALTYQPQIVGSALGHSLDPAVVAGIGSRESGWGTGVDMQPKGPTGTGDWKKRKPKPPLRGSMPPDELGFGRGLMQIDWDAYPFARSGPWQDPAANIAFGCGVLAQNVAFFVRKNLPQPDATRAAIAAYNHGAGNVWASISVGGMNAVDEGTAHGKYSADVLDRAKFFRANGFGATPDAQTHLEAMSETLALHMAAGPMEASAWPPEGSPEIDRVFGPIEVGPDGLPTSAWRNRHLTQIPCPWVLTLSWDQSKTTRVITCNRAVAESLSRVLDQIWHQYGQDQDAITRARMHLYGGCFEFRRKRGMSSLSLHAYGAAIDFDPDGNPMYDSSNPVEIHMPDLVVHAFHGEGWKWGNDFIRRKDPMHFQATSP